MNKNITFEEFVAESRALDEEIGINSTDIPDDLRELEELMLRVDYLKQVNKQLVWWALAREKTRNDYVWRKNSRKIREEEEQQEGRQEEKIEIAKNLLQAGVDKQVITKSTGQFGTVDGNGY